MYTATWARNRTRTPNHVIDVFEDNSKSKGIPLEYAEFAITNIPPHEIARAIKQYVSVAGLSNEITHLKLHHPSGQTAVVDLMI